MIYSKLQKISQLVLMLATAISTFQCNADRIDRTSEGSENRISRDKKLLNLYSPQPEPSVSPSTDGDIYTISINELFIDAYPLHALVKIHRRSNEISISYIFSVVDPGGVDDYTRINLTFETLVQKVAQKVQAYAEENKLCFKAEVPFAGVISEAPNSFSTKPFNLARDHEAYGVFSDIPDNLPKWKLENDEECATNYARVHNPRILLQPSSREKEAKYAAKMTEEGHLKAADRDFGDTDQQFFKIDLLSGAFQIRPFANKNKCMGIEDTILGCCRIKFAECSDELDHQKWLFDNGLLKNAGRKTNVPDKCLYRSDDPDGEGKRVYVKHCPDNNTPAHDQYSWCAIPFENTDSYYCSGSGSISYDSKGVSSLTDD